MPVQARTDRDLVSSSDEFVWEAGGHTEAHDYLINPVIAALRAQGAHRVLDLGCGNGAFTEQVRLAGFHVTGIDHSNSGIEIARRHYPEVQFAQHDLDTCLPDSYIRKYDAVISVEVIEHLLLPRKLLTAAGSALQTGGLFVVTAPFHGYWKNLALALTNGFDAHWHPLRDYGHIKFFSRATLTALLRESGFRNLRYSTAGRIPAFAKSMIISGNLAK